MMKELPTSFFIKSRSKLRELMLPSAAVIISSGRAMPRNADQTYPYRQSSDMYYLTGIRHAGCTLVMVTYPAAVGMVEILYIPGGDRKTEIWDGPGISVEQAQHRSGISDVRNVSQMDRDLRNMLSGCKTVYFGTLEPTVSQLFPSNEQEIRNSLRPLLMHLGEHQLAPLMTRIRMIKEPEELEMIKIAIRITEQGFRKVLEQIRPGIKEYELAALLTCVFQSGGAREHAFDPIVASGRNALVLHYIQNRDECRDGELVLLDFGAEWQYYAADISRTIPVNGKYNPRQRALYDACRRVLHQAMQLMQPGKTLAQVNDEVGKLWEEEHLRLGLYDTHDLNKQPEGHPLWKKYYWHGTSHSIGIDVHDCFDKTMPLKPGMVLSCEPGIYIEAEGVGIRLENDVLITENGPVNLSASIPDDPEELEDLLNRS
ncbi:MAG: aminopeptidase P N-terminal domain-containing protein [Bacteroidales bacterium]|nr:aminopeptidase P N-terminal domain-containing protein [Bacteroidales bacterium]